MKKLSLLLMLSVFVFCSCDNDDDVKNEVVISFENQLTENDSEFTTDKGQKDDPNNLWAYFKYNFKDPQNLATFEHQYSVFENTYTFAGFTYMNKTDNVTAKSPAPITGKAKNGKVYLAVCASDGEYGFPGMMTINDPNKYQIKGTWIANSTYAYMGMTVGDNYAQPFKAGSWFKVTAIGYNNADQKIGETSIYLANYATNEDLPSRDWLWFDLSSLHEAVKINFLASSSDSGTATYFCLDGITLIEK